MFMVLCNRQFAAPLVIAVAESEIRIDALLFIQLKITRKICKPFGGSCMRHMPV